MSPDTSHLSIITERRPLSIAERRPIQDPYDESYNNSGCDFAHQSSPSASDITSPSFVFTDHYSAFSSTSIYDDPASSGTANITDNNVDNPNQRLASAQIYADRRFRILITDEDDSDVQLAFLTNINSVYNSLTFLPLAIDSGPTPFYPLFDPASDSELCLLYDQAIHSQLEAVHSRFTVGQRFVYNLALHAELEEYLLN